MYVEIEVRGAAVDAASRLDDGVQVPYHVVEVWPLFWVTCPAAQHDLVPVRQREREREREGCRLNV